MQPLEPITQDAAGVKSPVNTQGRVPTEAAAEHMPIKAHSTGVTSEGYFNRGAACGHLHRTGSEPSGLSTSLSVPETGTCNELALHKASSHPSALSLGTAWGKPGGSAYPTMPITDSWATGVDQIEQPGQAVGSMGPSGAGDPALQVQS